jgi:hypothetical protein
LQVEGNVLNLGAVTFQPYAYPRYMALVDELGLRARVRFIPRREMALGIGGRVMRAGNFGLAAQAAAGLAGRGLFTPGEAVELVRFYFYMRRVTSPAHFAELLALQDRSVSEWAAQFGFSEGVRRKFVEPFTGFTFGAPERVNAAFGVLLLGFNLSKPAHLVGGMMQLPEALAARLAGHIETDARAARVERTAEGFATEYWKGGRRKRVNSDALVVAIPANVASGLVPEMRERAQGLKYSTGSAAVLRGKLKARGGLYLWRTDGAEGMALEGGEARRAGDGTDYINLLTYRGTPDAAARRQMFRDGAYETLATYAIAPAVAVPAPKQIPLPLDWGDRLYLAGDGTGLFPSQESAVRSGEEVASLLA